MTAQMTRILGRSGLKVSAMGLGCWAIGGPLWSGDTPNGWGEVDDNESIRAIHAGLDLGVNFLDTADVYGAGHSERVISRAIAGKRDKVVIATKFSSTFDEQTRQSLGPNVSPAYIRSACDASLRRLNTDYIDLYQFHNNGYDASKADAVRDTCEELVGAGKIRWYGWSTDYPESARVFAQGEYCSAIQHDFNVLDGSAEILDVCDEFDLASINRGPLAMGLLSGKYQAGAALAPDDVRGTRSPEWMKFFKDGKPSAVWLSKLDSIREILTSGGRTLAQGALAWLWGRSERTIPIPGFRTAAQVVENAAAMSYGPLTQSQMREIDTILGR